jgi:hypothetical protein
MAKMKWSKGLISEEGLIICIAEINWKFPVMATTKWSQGLVSQEGLMHC